jgi:hypothetical protein
MYQCRDENFPGIPGNPGFSRVFQGGYSSKKNKQKNFFFKKNDPTINFIHLKMQ